MHRSMRLTVLVAAAVPWIAAATLPSGGSEAAEAIPSDGPATASRTGTHAAVTATVVAPAVRFGDLTLSTGVRLHFAEQGDPRGRVLILLHGYSDSWFSFSRVLPLLPSGWHVYALDQRGHGDSDRPRAGYHMRDLAADVVAFMDAQGIARATVVGHSMGGFVAQQVALAAPDRVERLVLVCSGVRAQHISGVEELRAAATSFVDTVPVAFIRAFQESTIHVPVPEAFMARVVEESRKLPPHVWAGVAEGMLAAEPATAVARRGIPTLLMLGERDAVFERAAQDSLRAMYPRAAVRRYAATGHTPHWERPEGFARDLAAFVGSR